MAENKTIPRLKQLYNEQIAKELASELNIKNIHDVPKLDKIIVASGTGRNKDDKKHQEVVAVTLRKITGQEPTERIAKKSIASFKIRAGMGAPLGKMVTLRGDRMYEFLDRLVNVAMPRIRDFHGVPNKAFDGQGNYTLGISEQSIFPELTFEDTSVLHGLQITFVIKNGNKGFTPLDSSKSDGENSNDNSKGKDSKGGRKRLSNGAGSKALMEKFGIPFGRHEGSVRNELKGGK